MQVLSFFLIYAINIQHKKEPPKGGSVKDRFYTVPVTVRVAIPGVTVQVPSGFWV